MTLPVASGVNEAITTFNIDLFDSTGDRLANRGIHGRPDQSRVSDDLQGSFAALGGNTDSTDSLVAAGSITSVPEPASFALLSLGLLAAHFLPEGLRGCD